MLKHTIVVLLALTALGCGGGVSRQNLTTETYRAICAHYTQCGLTKSPDSCTQYFQAVIPTGASAYTSLYDKAIQLGKIKYDDGAAGRCLNSYSNASCDFSSLVGSDDCRSVYVGQVAVGETCGYGECIPSAFCSTEVDQKCPGTCKARIPAGSAATSFSECVIGTYPINGVCSKPVTEGSSCAGSTGSSVPCAAGLSCSTETKTCTKPKVAGSSAPCGGFLNCVDGKCATPGDVGTTCRQPAGGGFVLYPCKLELFCDSGSATPVCRDRLAEGQTCLSANCALNLRCAKATTSSATTTCNKPAAKDQFCEGSSSGGLGSCDVGLYCDSPTKTCKAQLVEGAACTPSDSCASGYCSSGKCVNFFASTCF